MEGDGVDENSAGCTQTRRDQTAEGVITTKRAPREVRDEQSRTTEQHVPSRIFGKTTRQERAVAVTTQEVMDG